MLERSTVPRATCTACGRLYRSSVPGAGQLVLGGATSPQAPLLFVIKLQEEVVVRVLDKCGASFSHVTFTRGWGLLSSNLAPEGGQVTF